jgi:adenylyl-sulfate kinase
MRGFTVWLTGLPCSGKSTLATHLVSELIARGCRAERLDGDVVRTHLSRGLGFTREDRDINVLRIGFVAQLLSRNGVVAVVAVVSPYAATRGLVREQIGRFVEVHVDCSIAECQRRDVKGMYARARAGHIQGFTGVDDPYEPPDHPEVTLHTERETVLESGQKILSALEDLGYLESTSSRAAWR